MRGQRNVSHLSISKQNPRILDDVKIIVQNAGFHLGYKRLEDWYTISKQDIKQNRKLYHILSNQGRTLQDLLTLTYPTHDWVPWKFETVPRGFWDQKRRLEYFDWLGQQLR